MFDASTPNDTIVLQLSRHRDGIRVHVQVQPEVEAFFTKWSGGLHERPSHGRQWKPATKAPGPPTT